MKLINRQGNTSYHTPFYTKNRDLDSEYFLEQEVRSGLEYVRWIQSSLNKIMRLRLAVDGIIGPMTRSAIRSFQRQYGLTVDGIVGPITEAKLIQAGASRPPGGGSASPGGTSPSETTFTQLPLSGKGYMRKLNNGIPQDAGRVWGHPQVIQALISIGSMWYQSHPSGPRIQIGDISFANGAVMAPHSSHRKGLDVDLRPVRNDGGELPVSFTDQKYSRALTQELVNLIRGNKVLSVRSILFNDPNVNGVTYWSGHNDHLHVSFNTPTEAFQLNETSEYLELNTEWELVLSESLGQGY